MNSWGGQGGAHVASLPASSGGLESRTTAPESPFVLAGVVRVEKCSARHFRPCPPPRQLAIPTAAADILNAGPVRGNQPKTLALNARQWFGALSRAQCNYLGRRRRRASPTATTLPMIKSPPALGIQQQPWDQTANRIVGKAARRVLLLAAFGAAVAFGYSLVAAPSGLSWWWVLIVPTSGIAMLAYTTAPSRKYFSPLLLSVFFFSVTCSC